MLYKITKQYARGTDIPVAEFNDMNDAKLFVSAKQEEDAKLRVKVTYRLFEGLDLLQEFTESAGSTSISSSGGGVQQKSSFQPTPFNNAPRPAGMPHSWVKDDEKKESEK
ncbi:MAG: hypothetical protein ACD_60C00105G0004 [uncultured bacterium]|nr:MAG: hypothetical protein ACD_60C00105G0004 [uncultured bacterium]